MNLRLSHYDHKNDQFSLHELDYSRVQGGGWEVQTAYFVDLQWGYSHKTSWNYLVPGKLDSVTGYTVFSTCHITLHCTMTLPEVLYDDVTTPSVWRHVPGLPCSLLSVCNFTSLWVSITEHLSSMRSPSQALNWPLTGLLATFSSFYCLIAQIEVGFSEIRLLIIWAIELSKLEVLQERNFVARSCELAHISL